jgi:hypothetical protein
MSSELLSAIIGGFIGGILGVLGTLISSYYGPRKMEEWREKRREELEYGPRKKILKDLLKKERYREGRSLERLCLESGTTQDECRRLLIEIGARGKMLVIDGQEQEGWYLP